ncbi:MAG TPA: hypothetical protein PLC86_08640 [Candidatus Accumulibacter phosphatis]|nr:hypothetical protein [Candidatus Accumulibacter phosphatis]
MEPIGTTWMSAAGARVVRVMLTAAPFAAPDRTGAPTRAGRQAAMRTGGDASHQHHSLPGETG